MPSHLVLDIGNVLCRWDGDALLQQVFGDPGEADAAREALVSHADWVSLDAGTLTVQEAAERAAGRCALPAARFVDLLEALPASLTPFEATHEAVITAQAAGVPVYILSNMQAHCWQHLVDHYRVFAGCRGIVVSCDIQLTKPDAAIYRHLTDRFSLAPEDCVFVDDMAENIAAAQACGWQGVQLTSPGEGPTLVRQLSADILS